MTKLQVSKIPQLNTIILKQEGEGQKFFISSPNSIVISIDNLSNILRFLICNDYMSYKVLQGLLEDYFTDRGAKKDA